MLPQIFNENVEVMTAMGFEDGYRFIVRDKTLKYLDLRSP